MNFDVIVVGGGAAGLACAVTFAQNDNNLRVCVIDAADRLAKKLAATGNGQGNVSNTFLTASHYHGSGAYLAEKIACGDPLAINKLFDCIFTADEKGRIYPAGKQASALGDSLLRKINSSAKVQIICNAKVEKIENKDGEFTVKGANFNAKSRYLVLCTGGKAAKQYKTDGSAYALATAFGHSITPLFPSLVQLKTDTTHIKTLKGIRADCQVTAYVDGQAVKSTRGDVIFTEYGVSGNAIFYLSAYVANKQNASLSIEFLPDVSSEEIAANLALRRASGGKYSELLSGNVHNQIGRAIISRAGNNATDEQIISVLKNFKLDVCGTLGFDYAQVTRGGVDVKDVTQELESKLVKNLFFAGEILDVDGDCGGYNLHWAFASGAFVAQNILKRL